MHGFFHLMLILSLFLWGSTVHGQTLEAKIDSLLRSKFQNGRPGASFLVSKNGRPVYRKAFGTSNLELKTPMISESVFEIGSMTKQFTAIAILMLVEKGKLNLSDDITKFIPDYPVRDKNITIHHLLTHTSGIKNFTSLKRLRSISHMDLKPLALIDIFKNEPMDFEPGEKFKYNNSGYVILGYIIEKVSGQKYSDFVEEYIFKKTGMGDSYYGNHKRVIANRASGYHLKEDYSNANRISYTIPYASGSLMSTVDDMLKWQNALIHGQLIKKNTLSKAFKNYKLNNGEFINYGYAWHLRTINGLESREHGGSIFGFKSMGIYIPSANIFAIGLSNCDCNSPTEITRQIALFALEEYE